MSCKFAWVAHRVVRAIFAALASYVFLAAGQLLAAENDGESLGGRLLDDLDPRQLSQPVEPLPRETPVDAATGATDDLDGKGIDKHAPTAPLVSAHKYMQTAASLLRHTGAEEDVSAAQNQAINNLDALVEQLAKKSRPSTNSSNGQRNSPSLKPSGTRPNAGGKGSLPAKDSTAGLRRGDPQAAETSATNPAMRQTMIKNLWGQLPPHAREQMLQMHSDEFLPKYELEIEKYFKRLAEEDDKHRHP